MLQDLRARSAMVRSQDASDPCCGPKSRTAIHIKSDAQCESIRSNGLALIIYFAQHIRLMGYRYLQSYVKDVLESIEAIEKIKAESHILAAPIYWPAFIAASEAFHEDLQRRFRDWYDEQVGVYGIEAVRSGISVLSEVWSRGPSASSPSFTSRWRMVLQETGAHLMLS